ncbi:hypothetical protein IFR05_002667 [Cadophora sp. M221]|nr:hypothetical protein IFR05_002667 [Cadophora sp. M221]
MIWLFTLPRCRLIQPILDRGGYNPYFVSTLRAPEDPPILQVSQQSRSEAQRFFEKRHFACSPTQYISSKFDILYFEHLHDFKRGGSCTNNILARCESVYEMNICENIALRLRTSTDIGREFLIWTLAWLWWFPRAVIITVVVNTTNPCKVRKLSTEIHYAANVAFGVVLRQDPKVMGHAWTPPTIEVVTESEFHDRSVHQLQEIRSPGTTTVEDQWFDKMYEELFGDEQLIFRPVCPVDEDTTIMGSCGIK